MAKKILTNKELLINLRNNIAYRMIDNKASILYFEEIAKGLKDNSQEKTDAFQTINTDSQNIKKDKLFLKCIDRMLKKEK